MTKLLPLLLAGPLACSIPPSDARVGVNGPSQNIGADGGTGQWDPVENFMGDHCGGLDCHGSTSRNFVVWSCYGLRLDPSAFPQPGCAEGQDPTTPAEYNATYRSLVGLEPNVMSVVVASGGADPDLLTFIRKARGEESHKGGTVAPEGSAGDTCMTSWLTGTTDLAACADALAGVDAGIDP